MGFYFVQSLRIFINQPFNTVTLAGLLLSCLVKELCLVEEDFKKSHATNLKKETTVAYIK